MRVGNLLWEEEAVSPVIGVILMVAITVILAAIVGVFVLGIGESQQTVPQATFEVEKDSEGSSFPDEMLIYHTGGNAIQNDELYLQIDGAQVQQWDGSMTSDRLSWKALGDGGDVVKAGDVVEFESDNGNPEIEDKTVRVVWDADGQTAIVFVWKGPKA